VVVYEEVGGGVCAWTGEDICVKRGWEDGYPTSKASRDDQSEG
jgi:hypothetical protein